MDLAQGVAPDGDVVDDAEVEDRVVALVGSSDPRRVTDGDAHSVAARCQTTPSPLHHARIQVEGLDPIGAEAVEDDLRTDAAATAHLEGDAAIHRPAHIEETLSLEVPLDGSADRVVHGPGLEAIEQHCVISFWARGSFQYLPRPRRAPRTARAPFALHLAGRGVPAP